MKDFEYLCVEILNIYDTLYKYKNILAKQKIKGVFYYVFF